MIQRSILIICNVFDLDRVLEKQDISLWPNYSYIFHKKDLNKKKTKKDYKFQVSLEKNGQQGLIHHTQPNK